MLKSHIIFQTALSTSYIGILTIDTCSYNDIDIRVNSEKSELSVYFFHLRCLTKSFHFNISKVIHIYLFFSEWTVGFEAF